MIILFNVGRGTCGSTPLLVLTACGTVLSMVMTLIIIPLAVSRGEILLSQKDVSHCFVAPFAAMVSDLQQVAPSDVLAAGGAAVEELVLPKLLKVNFAGLYAL